MRQGLPPPSGLQLEPCTMTKPCTRPEGSSQTSLGWMRIGGCLVRIRGSSTPNELRANFKELWVFYMNCEKGGKIFGRGFSYYNGLSSIL
jgi:hypothetical protein